MRIGFISALQIALSFPDQDWDLDTEGWHSCIQQYNFGESLAEKYLNDEISLFATLKKHKNDIISGGKPEKGENVTVEVFH